MKKVFSSFLLSITLLSLVGCSVDQHYESVSDDEGGSVGDALSSVTKVTVNKSNIQVPTLIIIMNWTNVTESGTDSFWHDKVFDTSANGQSSVNRWYESNTDNNITLIPASETFSSANDGVIRVNMGVDHFNKNNQDPNIDNLTTFRNIHVRNALSKAKTAGNINFSTFDSDGNGFVTVHELEIIFIVAGGEQSYGGPVPNALWGHAWSFDDVAPPIIDGVTLLSGDLNKLKTGSYAAFGAQHKDQTSQHPATIGIMVHELGHALYDLLDFYDTSDSGSGLGDYDIMSDGAWGQKSASEEAGETPTQFSAYNKIATSQNVLQSSVSGENITLKCSANEFIKLPTLNANEYFLVECRDTSKIDSDRAFNFSDPNFTDNKLVAIAYHIDEEKKSNISNGDLVNSENGPQTVQNHYMASMVEKSSPLMTAGAGRSIDFSDVYTQGYIIDKSKLSSYARDIGYYVEVKSANYSQRTMSFRVSQ